MMIECSVVYRPIVTQVSAIICEYSSLLVSLIYLTATAVPRNLIIIEWISLSLFWFYNKSMHACTQCVLSHKYTVKGASNSRIDVGLWLDVERVGDGFTHKSTDTKIIYIVASYYPRSRSFDEYNINLTFFDIDSSTEMAWNLLHETHGQPRHQVHTSLSGAEIVHALCRLGSMRACLHA